MRARLVIGHLLGVADTAVHAVLDSFTRTLLRDGDFRVALRAGRIRMDRIVECLLVDEQTDGATVGFDDHQQTFG